MLPRGMRRVAAHASRASLVPAAMTLGNAMILVDQTAVPLALPDIMDDLVDYLRPARAASEHGYAVAFVAVAVIAAIGPPQPPSGCDVRPRSRSRRPPRAPSARRTPTGPDPGPAGPRPSGG